MSEKVRVELLHGFSGYLGFHLIRNNMTDGLDTIIGGIHVSTSAYPLENLDEETTELIEAFFIEHPEIDLAGIAEHCKHSIHHGRNDRVVPFSKALQMEKILKTKVRKIDGGKHLNAETPRKKLKKLVRRIIADIDRMTLT